MPTHNNLNSLFTDIADAIRDKTGSTDTIKADDFPTAISEISAGGDGFKMPSGSKLTGWYLKLEDSLKLSDVVENKTIRILSEYFYGLSVVLLNTPPADPSNLPTIDLTGLNFERVKNSGRSTDYQLSNFCRKLTLPSYGGNYALLDLSKINIVYNSSGNLMSGLSYSFAGTSTTTGSPIIGVKEFLTKLLPIWKVNDPTTNTATNSYAFSTYCGTTIAPLLNNKIDLDIDLLTDTLGDHYYVVGNNFFADNRIVETIILGTAFKLPTNVQNVFKENYSLKNLVIKDTEVRTINANSFANCYHILGTTQPVYNPTGAKDGYIYVPDELVATYQATSGWSTVASQIRPLSQYTGA